VANYRWVPDFDVGRFDLTLSASHNDIKITRLPTTNVLSSLNPAPALIGYVNRMTLTQGQPDWKASFVGDWTQNIFGATLKATYYGKLIQPGTDPTGINDLHLKPKTLVDFEARVNPTARFQVAIGAENLFDVYPTEFPGRLNPNGVAAWPEYSPFGFQGRYVYVRGAYSW
jgi:iron complex outermembrane receptor protein